MYTLWKRANCINEKNIPAKPQVMSTAEYFKYVWKWWKSITPLPLLLHNRYPMMICSKNEIRDRTALFTLGSNMKSIFACPSGIGDSYSRSTDNNLLI